MIAIDTTALEARFAALEKRLEALESGREQIASPTLSRAEAARYLGVALRTFDALIADGAVETKRVRRRVVVRRKDLDQWLAAGGAR